jgi:hypothetical protein
MMHQAQLRRLRHHLLARLLDARAERDDDVRLSAKTIIVAVLGTRAAAAAA